MVFSLYAMKIYQQYQGRIALADIKFGTDGWRGIIADTFTFENLILVAQATAEFVKRESWPWEKGCFIGYDTRFFSEVFAKTVAEVFAANGIKTFIAQRFVPTPFVTFEIVKNGRGFGVAITASHNPYQYNGYKLRTPKGGAAPSEITGKIEALLDGVKPKRIAFEEGVKEGLITVVNPYPAYFEWVKERVDLDRIGRASFKVVANPMHGATSDLTRLFLEPAGCFVELINEKRDAFFGFKHPEPIEKNIRELIARVIDSKADVGIATDGDGDRVGLVDEKGNFVNPHQIYALILMHLVKNKGFKGAIAKTVSTTSLLDRIGEKYGIKVYETGVGFKFIADLIADGRVFMGGEESGGIGVSYHIPERDGLFSALLVLEYMAVEAKPLSRLIEELFEEFGPHFYRREDVKVSRIEDARSFVEHLKSEVPRSFAGLSVRSTNFVDGAKFVLEDNSWILFRASGTEPLLRVYCESSSVEKLEKILGYGKELVSRYLSG